MARTVMTGAASRSATVATDRFEAVRTHRFVFGLWRSISWCAQLRSPFTMMGLRSRSVAR